MKIAIDISQIVYEGTGVSRFTDGLVHSILRNESRHEWVFFYQTFRRHIKASLIQEISDKGYSYRDFLMPPSLGTIFWNQLRFMSIDSLMHGTDWYISSDWTEPPSKSKKATIVHDLIFKRYPETVDPYVKSVMERKIALATKECKVIFADSEATKNDLIEYYKIAEKKVVINYPGVSPLPLDGIKGEDVKKKYSISKPYFITVGKQEPRKNIVRLMRAFHKLNTDHYELLVVGQKGWGEQKTDSGNIRFLGYVPDNELSCLYSNSQGMVFPSLYEGFGYPAVEAMLANTPVALSKTSSLQEIGKGAAVFFDPEDVNSISKSMEQLMDNKIRKELISKGNVKAKEYTWERYYDTLIRTLEEHS